MVLNLFLKHLKKEQNILSRLKILKGTKVKQ